MRALWVLAALVALWAPRSQGFIPPFFGSYREASQNYYEIMTNCDKEGGDCIDVDFGTTDPPPPPPPTTRAPPPPPTTPAPPPPPIFITLPPFFNPFFFWAPQPVQPAPPATTRAPPATTRAPLKTTRAPARGKTTRKLKGKKARGGENEREVRRRRAADVYQYLYKECSGGWEFDLGCGVKGNVCCYSSSNSYKKKK